MELRPLIDAIRGFPGITRKNSIHEIVKLLPTTAFVNVAASEGEDAAAIEFGDHYILFATDGIMESLVRDDPFLAGYYAVLVNVNDIAAMGGRPLAMVDVMSSKDDRICSQILKGMEAAVKKFNVPIVGGHTHPDCKYNAIDISIVGTVSKDALLRSDTAMPGDDIVFIIDTDGYYPEEVPYAFVTTMGKPGELVRAQMEAVARAAEKHLIHACKDMSNPGDIGTLGMMLESSGKGATVDVNLIPRPHDVDEIRWHLSYQGCGFVFSCDPSHSAEVIEIFKEVGCDGAVVGKVDDSRILRLTDGVDTAVLFDFSNDIITGIVSDRNS